MQDRSRTLRLGGQDLAPSRHVCGLFEGPDAALDVVAPFVLEGLAQAERIFCLVQAPDAFRGRLAGKRGLASVVDAQRVEVRTWSDSYLPDGRFSATRTLAYLRVSLRDGSAHDYRGTRLIGEMAWGQDDVPDVDELIAYESGVDAILGRPRDAILCVYDVRSHSASRIAAIQAVHEAVFVGRRLQRVEDFGAATPRERILTAAFQLFAQSGVRAAGVDSLIESAGVAKATFYRHFRSKENLIVAWLEDPRTRWFERVRGRAEARADSPVEVIPRFFEALADWLETGDFRGCPYLNTSLEIPDPEHPASRVVRQYLQDIARDLGDIVRVAGYRDAVRVGTELQLLVAGCISLAVAHRTSSFALDARDVAVRLVADLPKARPRESRTRPTPPS
jgi:AcrR family transcriptional regulator